MRAVQIKAFGGPDELYMGEWPLPVPGERDVLVKVEATALNRADSLQRQGKYPPPAGESPILGLEMAGRVSARGAGVSKWQIGDEVCGLLGGGGYAEYVCIHEELAMPVPAGLSTIEAAAIPEVFLTAYQSLCWLARLQAGETVLIHAGASGVGTAAIQLARAMGGQAIVTASAGKHGACLQLGAEKAIDYQQEDFAVEVLAHTANKGVDVVLDFIGAPNLPRNLEVLRPDGRLVLLALMGGAQAERLSLGPVLSKRLQILGSTLRARPLAYKIELSQALYRFAWPLFEQGQLKPVVDTVFDWEDAAEAHRYLEANRNVGKILLKVGAA
jgi:tumor protein p53-inducible protein 3